MDKLLKQFLTVAELNSLSHAATRLFISQPTLTHNIKKLEDNLGVELFVRSSKGMALTPYGELLMEQTRIMQRVHDNAMEKLAQLKVKRERGLRIGVGMAWWHLFFRDLLQDYRRENPTAPVHVDIGNHLRSMDQLLCGDIDLFIGHEIVGLNERAGAVFNPLFQAFDGCYVRAGHPLLAQSSCSLVDLLAYPHLDVTPDEARYTQVLDNLALKQAQRERYYVPERVVWATNSMTAGLDILRDSDAVMTYTNVLADYFAQQGVLPLPIEEPQGPHTVGLYVLAERADDEHIQHITRLIQQHVASAPFISQVTL
ncbi:LysR family transcriptional regulator [Salinispirillum sp. LH 10-3-1]|uniref:LysR family transcriptional regulator n=1 Tax=Salinispirillum sp. LH 10-3-1 TaxID=2952525 RepID=A0AB38YEL1_9GAMM